jgi:hypothetical protein
MANQPEGFAQVGAPGAAAPADGGGGGGGGTQCVVCQTGKGTVTLTVDECKAMGAGCIPIGDPFPCPPPAPAKSP